MKANEAPEKLYFGESDKGILDIYSTKESNNEVEYTRTDAFVEKAVSWLKEHKEAVETEDNGIMGCIPDYFIEDFRKYMEESKV